VSKRGSQRHAQPFPFTPPASPRICDAAITEPVCLCRLQRCRQPLRDTGRCSAHVAALLMRAGRPVPSLVTSDDDALTRIERWPKSSPSTRPRRLTCRTLATSNGAERRGRRLFWGSRWWTCWVGVGEGWIRGWCLRGGLAICLVGCDGFVDGLSDWCVN
jgi:hypothetical protein